MSVDFNQLGDQLIGYLHGRLLVPVDPFREPFESLEKEFEMWYGWLIIEDEDYVKPVPVGRFLSVVDSIAEILNQAENPLEFSHGCISFGIGARQKIHKCGHVVFRLTASYDCKGAYTNCPDHLDWEECEDTNCQFEPVKIHGRGTKVYIDCMVKKQDSLVAIA